MYHSVTSSELKRTHDSFTDAYAEFLQSGNVPSSLENDIYRLQQHEQRQQAEGDEEVNMSFMYMYNTSQYTIHCNYYHCKCHSCMYIYM